MSKYIANKLFNDKISIYVTECLSTNDFLTNLLKRNKIREGDSGLALGYGRKLAGPVGDGIGFDANQLLNKKLNIQNLTRPFN